MESDSKRLLTVGVTGAKGYVGSAVCEALADAGHNVIALTRTRSDKYQQRIYELTALPAPGLLKGIDVVIHCAYDWGPISWDDIVRVNIEGTRALVEATQVAGARFILISSVSAFDGTRQMYGRAKLACERLALAAGGNAVRLGTVYGGANGGMFGLLLRLARLPVIPVPAAHSPQALVRVDNAAAALVALAESDVSGELIGLASPATMELGELMRAVSSSGGRSAIIVPLPWLPAYVLLKLVERAGFGLPLRSETVLGLARPARALASIDVWQTLGVEIEAPNPALEFGRD